jgi:drug/metabolite transporter (DMT)-like permease
VLGRVKLSVAFPFYGLSFVFVPLLAWWWLGEPLGWRSLAGGLLIIAGLMVISGGKGAT